MDQIPAVETMKPEELASSRVLAREFAEIYRQRTALYREHPEMETNATKEDSSYVLGQAPDQVNWWGLQSLAEHDSDAAQAVWSGIIAQAQDELISGHRAQEAMTAHRETLPIDRARFLVLRARFREEWKCRGGIEDSLIDMMAQCFTLWEYWAGMFQMRSFFEGREEKEHVTREGKWIAPTIGTADALDQAAANMDRFNKLYMRTLRALRDLRRYPVVIQNAGQVNVGERQVNINSSGS